MSARFVTGSTGIVVTVPESEPAVRAVRVRHDPAAAYGVPPHVTVEDVPSSVELRWRSGEHQAALTS